MRFFPGRSVNLKSAAAMPAALATRPTEAIERAQAAATEILEAVERGRSAASEIVEAARSAMPIEAIRPARRRGGRRAMTFTALALTAAAATAAYVWWKRHDSVDAGMPDMNPASPMPRDPMAPMAPDTNEPGGSFNAAVPPTQTSVLPSDTPRVSPEPYSAPHPSGHPSPMHTPQPPMPGGGTRFAMPPSNSGGALPYGRVSLP